MGADKIFHERNILVIPVSFHSVSSIVSSCLKTDLFGVYGIMKRKFI